MKQKSAAKTSKASKSSKPSGVKIEDVRALYLDMMKRSVKDHIYGDARFGGPDYSDRPENLVYPSMAHTMVGFECLNNVQFCIDDILKNGVEGDFIETGVWRGGTTIFMRAMLAAYGVKDRTVWVADSFEGLPAPNAADFPADEGLDFTKLDDLSVSLEQVKANFARYGMIEGQVEFLKGWFKDTLPDAPIEKLALMRLDGDLYESTIQALDALYPKLSVGGYVIIDDYGFIPACKQAVHDFREQHDIEDKIHIVDANAVFWQRTR